MVWGIIIILFLLPSYLIRFTIFDIPFTMLEVMIIALFVIHVVLNTISLAKPRKRCAPMYERMQRVAVASSIDKFWYFIIALLLTASIISLLVTPDLRAGAGIWKAYILEPILFFIVCSQSLHTKKDVTRCLSALGFSATIIAIIALAQYVTGWHIPAPWHDFPGRRATAVYGYPNAVGLTIAPIVTMLIGTLVSGSIHNRKKQMAVISMIVLCLAALVVSRSDGAIVAVAAATGAMLLFTQWRWQIIIIGLICFTIALSIEPIRHILLFQDVSGDVRLALWKGTLHLLRAHPFAGAGLAGFPLLYDLYRLPSHVELLEYAHNIFFDFWIQLGIGGLIWILSTFVYIFIRIKHHIRAKNPLGIILLGVFVSIVVYGLVDVPYFKNDLSVLFWFWLALFATQKTRNE